MLTAASRNAPMLKKVKGHLISELHRVFGVAPWKQQPSSRDQHVVQVWWRTHPCPSVCVSHSSWRCDGELLGHRQTDGPHSRVSVSVTETLWHTHTHTCLKKHHWTHTSSTQRSSHNTDPPSVTAFKNGATQIKNHEDCRPEKWRWLLTMSRSDYNTEPMAQVTGGSIAPSEHNVS